MAHKLKWMEKLKMLRITIELVPFGLEKESRVLGIAEIMNDGTGDYRTGNYKARLSKWSPKTNEDWKTTVVTGFLRKSKGPWDLLYRVLHNIVGERNKD